MNSATSSATPPITAASCASVAAMCGVELDADTAGAVAKTLARLAPPAPPSSDTFVVSELGDLLRQLA